MSDLSLSRAGSLRIHGASEQERLQAATVLVITTDGKGINMRHEDLRPPTKKAAEIGRTKRKKKRQAKGEKRNRDQAIAEHAAGRFGIGEAIYQQAMRNQTAGSAGEEGE